MGYRSPESTASFRKHQNTTHTWHRTDFESAVYYPSSFLISLSAQESCGLSRYIEGNTFKQMKKQQQKIKLKTKQPKRRSLSHGSWSFCNPFLMTMSLLGNVTGFPAQAVLSAESEWWACQACCISMQESAGWQKMTRISILLFFTLWELTDFLYCA